MLIMKQFANSVTREFYTVIPNIIAIKNIITYFLDRSNDMQAGIRNNLSESEPQLSLCCPIKLNNLKELNDYYEFTF